jgi:hypothetical protein
MKKLLLTNIAVLFLATGMAHAEDIKIRIIRDSSGSLPCRPTSMSTRLGCAIPPDETDEECVIYIADDGDLELAGRTYKSVLRHEIRHCKGWRHK